MVQQLGKVHGSEMKFWAPSPGEVLDMKGLTVQPSAQTGALLPPLLEGMADIDELLSMELQFKPLQSFKGIQQRLHMCVMVWMRRGGAILSMGV